MLEERELYNLDENEIDEFNRKFEKKTKKTNLKSIFKKEKK